MNLFYLRKACHCEMGKPSHIHYSEVRVISGQVYVWPGILYSLVVVVGSLNFMVAVNGLLMNDGRVVNAAFTESVLAAEPVSVFSVAEAVFAIAVSVLAIADAVLAIADAVFTVSVLVSKSEGVRNIFMGNDWLVVGLKFMLETGTLMLVLVVAVMGDNSGVFVMDGARVVLMVEFNMGLLLVVLLVMGVVVSRDFVVDGVVVDNAGLVVMVLVVRGQVLDVVVRVLVVVLVMGKFTVVAIVTVLVMVGKLVVGSVVAVGMARFVMGGFSNMSSLVSSLVSSSNFVLGSSNMLRVVVVVSVGLRVVSVVVDRGGVNERSVLIDGVLLLTSLSRETNAPVHVLCGLVVVA